MYTTRVCNLPSQSATPRHTILLVQVTQSPRTRSFYDFESKTGALDGVVRIFEEHLKTINPRAHNITYDVQVRELRAPSSATCATRDPENEYRPQLWPRYTRRTCSTSWTASATFLA